MDYVLGADIGSGSVKLTLLAQNGNIVADAQCEYPTLYPCVGWCEQNPEDWCQAFRKALQLLLQKASITPEHIKAVAPDAATHTAVLLDEHREVIRPAILWTDQRSTEQVQKLRDDYLSLIRQHSSGIQNIRLPFHFWSSLIQCLYRKLLLHSE